MQVSIHMRGVDSIHKNVFLPWGWSPGIVAEVCLLADFSDFVFQFHFLESKN